MSARLASSSDAPVALAVRLAGAELDPGLPLLAARTVQEAHRPDTARLTVAASGGRDGAMEPLPAALIVGADLVLAAGNRTASSTLFQGRVTRLTLQLGQSRQAVWIIDAIGVTAPAPPPPASLTLTYGETLISCDLATDLDGGARVVGVATCPGVTPVAPGQSVLLAGLGAPLNGPAFITSVVQLIASGAWRTTLTVGAAHLPFTVP